MGAINDDDDDEDEEAKAPHDNFSDGEALTQASEEGTICRLTTPFTTIIHINSFVLVEVDKDGATEGKTKLHCKWYTICCPFVSSLPTFLL